MAESLPWGNFFVTGARASPEGTFHRFVTQRAPDRRTARLSNGREPMARILVIEDEPDLAKILEYNLRQEKFAVEIGKNGEEGLTKARRGSPDLIVLDLMLPDLDGLEVCRRLKSDSKTKAIPVLMLTAKGNEMDRVVGFEVGADDYLTKPFSPRELVLRIRAILKRIRCLCSGQLPERMQTEERLH